jgi:hypothetical protein
VFVWNEHMSIISMETEIVIVVRLSSVVSLDICSDCLPLSDGVLVLRASSIIVMR